MSYLFCLFRCMSQYTSMNKAILSSERRCADSNLKDSLKKVYTFSQSFLCLDDWRLTEFPLTKMDHGKWELKLPARPDGSCPIPHNSFIKVSANM